MKIRKDDNVIVTSGKDRGKTGKVVRALPKENKVIVAGVNVIKVHKRATKAGGKGQMVDKTMPIHVSNVMVIDPSSKKGTRVKISRDAGKDGKRGKKVRIATKSGTSI